MYQIIEDCSPYYIRYTHDGIQDIFEYANLHTPNLQGINYGFKHHVFKPDQADAILSMIPTHKQIPLEKDRVSLFMTSPRLYYRAHKDGSYDHVSINYTCKILDDKCITSWYSDEDLSIYNIDTLDGQSRECFKFDKTKHNPVKSMIAKPNEAILFNSEIYHDWDNSQSDNERVVLTLRPVYAIRPQIYFETMRNLMFEFKKEKYVTKQSKIHK